MCRKLHFFFLTQQARKSNESGNAPKQNIHLFIRMNQNEIQNLTRWITN